MPRLSPQLPGCHNDAAPLDELMLELREASQLHLETMASLNRGLDQASRGEGIPLKDAENQLRSKHGFSRDASTPPACRSRKKSPPNSATMMP